MPEGTPIIELRGLAKHYGSVRAVSAVDLAVAEGEFVTLLGPSGCGKTTIIRMIAGYIMPTAGQVLLDGRDITYEPPQRRRIGMVFQHYALFPHLTVEENIGFALRVEGRPREVIRRRVAEMLDLVRLPGIGDRRPGQLSGGQQQRVALARALAFNPRILLMDEPLGALDLKLREQMQVELKRIQRDVGITTIHVTHDQEEALGLSDRVVVMAPGRIAQVDTPERLYDAPASRYVADFVGKINFLEAEVMVVTHDAVACRVLGLEGSGATLHCATRKMVRAGERVTVGLRPEHLTARPGTGDAGRLQGHVEKTRFVGSYQFVTVRLGPGLAVIVADPQRACAIGKDCVVDVDESRAVLFAAEDRGEAAAGGAT
jgi:spermidine/putrescine ABC transporter ATP-binding subunit